jgi:hypothetical protein
MKGSVSLTADVDTTGVCVPDRNSLYAVFVSDCREKALCKLLLRLRNDKTSEHRLLYRKSSASSAGLAKLQEEQ